MRGATETEVVAAVGLTSTHMRADSIYAVHDARGYNAYGQQRVSPFRLDQIMPRRYADDGGARSDGVGGRADSPTNVRARARLGRFVLQPGRSTQRLQQKDVASLKTTTTTTLPPLYSTVLADKCDAPSNMHIIS